MAQSLRMIAMDKFSSSEYKERIHNWCELLHYVQAYDS